MLEKGVQRTMRSGGSRKRNLHLSNRNAIQRWRVTHLSIGNPKSHSHTRSGKSTEVHLKARQLIQESLQEMINPAVSAPIQEDSWREVSRGRSSRARLATRFSNRCCSSFIELLLLIPLRPLCPPSLTGSGSTPGSRTSPDPGGDDSGIISRLSQARHLDVQSASRVAEASK